jgi:hypothetical protein
VRTNDTYLLPVPSPLSLAEPENSIASVSPERVLERFTNSFPSSSSLTQTLNAVLLWGTRQGKLAVRQTTMPISEDQDVT